MRVRSLFVIGGVVALIGVAAGVAVEALSDVGESNEGAFIVAGLSIVVLLAAGGFVAGWFGRERDDVVVAAVGAGQAIRQASTAALS